MKRAFSLLLVCCIILVTVGCQSSPSVTTSQTPTSLNETATDTITDSLVVSVPSVVSQPVSVVTPPSTVPSSQPSSVSSQPASTVSKPVEKPKPKPVLDTNLTEIVNYIQRPSYQSVQNEIAALAEAYPQLISTESIGTSVQGRDITLIKLGTGSTKACIIAGIHARETITVSYAMRCIEEFCVAYTDNTKIGSYDIKQLLDTYTLYMVPLSNPDGLEIVTGRAQPEVTITYRKKQYSNEYTTIADYKGNANGVNLNKNFPLLWEKINNKVTTPDAENYKGPSAASEPETQALMQLCEANDFVFMTSLHVKGDCLYWSDTLNPNVGVSKTVATRLEKEYGFYKCKTSDDVNGFGGGFENWFREAFKKPGFCLELMPLEETVDPLSDSNHKYFSKTVRWEKTKAVLPFFMTLCCP